MGVIVHAGGANAGHYISFIKSRESNKWFEFDDEKVSFFNEQDLKDECFGSDKIVNPGYWEDEVF